VKFSFSTHVCAIATVVVKSAINFSAHQQNGEEGEIVILLDGKFSTTK
jgi:hypothetical protein